MSSLYLAPAKQSTPLSFGEGHGVRLLKKNLGENVEISQKLRIFAAELVCGPPYVFAGHSRVAAVG